MITTPPTEGPGPAEESHQPLSLVSEPAPAVSEVEATTVEPPLNLSTTTSETVADDHGTLTVKKDASATLTVDPNKAGLETIPTGPGVTTTPSKPTLETDSENSEITADTGVPPGLDLSELEKMGEGWYGAFLLMIRALTASGMNLGGKTIEEWDTIIATIKNSPKNTAETAQNLISDLVNAKLIDPRIEKAVVKLLEKFKNPQTEIEVKQAIEAFSAETQIEADVQEGPIKDTAPVEPGSPDTTIELTSGLESEPTPMLSSMPSTPKPTPGPGPAPVETTAATAAVTPPTPMPAPLQPIATPTTPSLSSTSPVAPPFDAAPKTQAESFMGVKKNLEDAAKFGGDVLPSEAAETGATPDLITIAADIATAKRGPLSSAVPVPPTRAPAPSSDPLTVAANTATNTKTTPTLSSTEEPSRPSPRAHP